MRPWLLLTFVCLSFSISAQVADTSKVLSFAQQMPRFVGGDTAMYKFIKQNINYPKMCLDSGVQGKVFVRFIVAADGKLKDAEVVKGVCSDLNNEALRVVSQMPDFIAGKQNGQNVDVYYTVPITFKLSRGVLPIKTSSIFTVLSTCDRWPEYPDGDSQMKEFLLKNTTFPKDGTGSYIRGSSTIGFVVDSTGKVGSLKVISTTGKEMLDWEAQRIVKTLPVFKPALLKGKAVSAYVLLKFDFYQTKGGRTAYKGTKNKEDLNKEHRVYSDNDKEVNFRENMDKAK